MRRCVLSIILTVVLTGVVVGICIAVAMTRKPSMRTTFIARCEAFMGHNMTGCQKIWGVFEQAYVGLDPCEVPVEAYDPLMAAVPLEPACNRMMFSSKTKDVVRDFTKKRDCFLTVEKTALGSMLDGLTWCGREGRKQTFTTDCPRNPVSKFWARVSANFADSACGNVSVMLNGSISTPFNRTSVFASIEVKRFLFPRVKSLKVVLVTQKNSVTNCTNASLKELQKELLYQEITYDCKEVDEARIQECGSNAKIPCGSCW